MFMNDNYITQVIEFALKAHEGQPRKGTSIPYIVHPIETGIILAQNGASESVIMAGILHDILEDTTKTEDDMLSILRAASLEPEYVLDLVCAATEPLKLEAKREGFEIPPKNEKDSWRERKEHTLRFLRELSGDPSKRDVQLVICADKLSNIRAMVHDYREEELKSGNGMNFFDRFNAGYQEQKWYYESLVKAFQDLENYILYREFKQHIKELFQNKVIV